MNGALYSKVKLSCRLPSCAYFSKTTVRCFGTLKNSYLVKGQLRLMWTLELTCFVFSKFCYCIAKFMTVAWTKQQVMVYLQIQWMQLYVRREGKLRFPHTFVAVCVRHSSFWNSITLNYKSARSVFCGNGLNCDVPNPSFFMPRIKGPPLKSSCAVYKQVYIPCGLHVLHR